MGDRSNVGGIVVQEDGGTRAGGRRMRGRWWKCSNDSRNAPTFQGRSHAMDPPDGHYERAIIKVGETMLLKKQEMVLLTKAE